MSKPSNEHTSNPAGWRYVSKRRAFLSHLALSATIVGSVCIAIFVFWYPPPYFTVNGAWNVLRVLIGVDLILGPLLTLILFRPGKRGLALDMAMIALIQLSALIYGTSVIFHERPYYLVFAVDRYEVHVRREVDAADAREFGFTSKPWMGPIVAFAQRPTDVATYQKLLQETVFEGAPDIDRRPAFWRPLADHRDAVLARTRALAELALLGPNEAAMVEAASAALGKAAEEALFVPVVAGGEASTLIIDPESALPVAALPINPWLAAASVQ